MWAGTTRTQPDMAQSNGQSALHRTTKFGLMARLVEGQFSAESTTSRWEVFQGSAALRWLLLFAHLLSKFHVLYCVFPGDSLLSSVVQLRGEWAEETRYSCAEQSWSCSGGIGGGMEGIFQGEMSTASHSVFYVSCKWHSYCWLWPWQWLVLVAGKHFVKTSCVMYVSYLYMGFLLIYILLFTGILVCVKHCHMILTSAIIHHVSFLKTNWYSVAHNFTKCWSISKFFTLRLGSKRVMKQLLKIPPHRNTTLWIVDARKLPTIWNKYVV